MADRVNFSVHCTPIETLSSEEANVTTDILAGEVGTSLGGNGSADVTNYSSSSDIQGYENKSAYYKEAPDAKIIFK